MGGGRGGDIFLDSVEKGLCDVRLQLVRKEPWFESKRRKNKPAETTINNNYGRYMSIENGWDNAMMPNIFGWLTD